VLERDTAAVLLIIDGRKAPVPVAFGESGKEASLARQLSKFSGLSWTQSKRKLIVRNRLALSSHASH